MIINEIEYDIDDVTDFVEKTLELIEKEEWENLIAHYQTRLERGEKEYCLLISDIYISELHQYQKAIDFLMPYYIENPQEQALRQEIQTAKNYIEKKEVVLHYRDFQMMGEDDMFRLFYDANLRRINKKKFSVNLRELFEKYDFLSVDLQDNIYGIKGDQRVFLRNETDAYSIANDLIEN